MSENCTIKLRYEPLLLGARTVWGPWKRSAPPPKNTFRRHCFSSPAMMEDESHRRMTSGVDYSGAGDKSDTGHHVTVFYLTSPAGSVRRPAREQRKLDSG